MEINRVYFTGSLPKKGQVPIGGGEVGNMRTIMMLVKHGYEIKVVRRLVSTPNDTKWSRLMGFPFRMFTTLVRWFIVLLFGRRGNSIVHVSGFYGNTIIIETLQVGIATLLGYKIVYELRGGGAIKFYEEGSKIYRKQFEYILRKADYLFSQGRENEPLIRKICKTPIFYYPNCVQQAFYPEKMTKKPTDKINLLFFGRIESNKNPLLIMKATSLLQKEFPNIHLTIIGNGNVKLIAKLKKEMKQTLEAGSYVYIPGCKHEELKPFLANQHFYVFPSEQPREGQSNAVTEAMSYGIIPIASPQGFNRSTIGDNELIVDEMTVEAYSERIKKIIKSNKIDYYSQFVRQRFMENYTEMAVFNNLTKTYDAIFSQFK